MLIPLHKQAHPALAVRARIAASSETASVLDSRYGVTSSTI